MEETNEVIPSNDSIEKEGQENLSQAPHINKYLDTSSHNFHTIVEATNEVLTPSNSSTEKEGQQNLFQTPHITYHI